MLQTTVFKDPALQATVFKDSALQATVFTVSTLQALMSVDSALQATMSAGSALQATVFLVTPSTLLLASGGKGIQTGNNKGEFGVTSNFILPPALLFDCGVVRTKSLPQSEGYLLLSFNKLLPETYEESRLCLAKQAIIMFQFFRFRYMAVEKMFERIGSVAGDVVFLSPTINLKSHILKTLCYGDFGDVSKYTRLILASMYSGSGHRSLK